MALANGVRGAIRPCFLRAYTRLVFQEFFHVYPLDLGSSEARAAMNIPKNLLFQLFLSIS